MYIAAELYSSVCPLRCSQILAVILVCLTPKRELLRQIQPEVWLSRERSCKKVLGAGDSVYGWSRLSALSTADLFDCDLFDVNMSTWSYLALCKP